MKKNKLYLILVILLLVLNCAKDQPLKTPSAEPVKYFLIDNCEGNTNINYLKGKWYTSADPYGDTMIFPKTSQDFFMYENGSLESPKYCARIYGYIGPQAGQPPYGVNDYASAGAVCPLAPLSSLTPFDASNFTGIRFNCKIGYYKIKPDKPFNPNVLVILRRQRTEDATGGEFQTEKNGLTPGEWILVELPFSSFSQGSWIAPTDPRKREAEPYDDLLAIYFYPNTGILGLGRDSNFDISIDDIGFYK